MKSYALTDRGTVRNENQDCARVTEIRACGVVAAVVCDGMGGVHGGKLASELAASAFMAEFRRGLLAGSRKRPALEALLRAACDAANRVVYQYSCTNTECAGMGTTLVAAALHGASAAVLNVGDSRAYLLAPRRMTQVTKDHSLVQAMVDAGELTSAQARRHPKRNFVTRAVGVDAQVRADCFTLRLRPGERLLLCSDGLTNTLPDACVSRLCRTRSAERACRRLIAEALAQGARDNVTAVIVCRPGAALF